MWLLIAEAFIALGLFVFIVWWTMSSRRRTDDTAAKSADPADPADRGVTVAAEVSVPSDPGAQPPGRDQR